MWPMTPLVNNCWSISKQMRTGLRPPIALTYYSATLSTSTISRWTRKPDDDTIARNKNTNNKIKFR